MECFSIPSLKPPQYFMASVSVAGCFFGPWTEVLWRATGFQRDISILKVSLSWCCVRCVTVDGWRNLANQLRKGSLSHDLQGFIHPRWCRISAINSMVCVALPETNSKRPWTWAETHFRKGSSYLPPPISGGRIVRLWGGYDLVCVICVSCFNL